MVFYSHNQLNIYMGFKTQSINNNVGEVIF
jgi:hypothetical protein